MGENDTSSTRRSVIKKAAAFAGGSLAAVTAGSSSVEAKKVHEDPLSRPGYPQGTEDKARLEVTRGTMDDEYITVFVHNPSEHSVYRGRITVYYQDSEGAIFKSRSQMKYFFASGEERGILFRRAPGTVKWDATATVEKLFE